MPNQNECQIPCLAQISYGLAEFEPQPLMNRLKRRLARPWNYSIKIWLKKITRMTTNRRSTISDASLDPHGDLGAASLSVGDWVRVRSEEEIRATLDRWHELQGCAFLEYMWQYCGSTQQVLQVMERFLDERDYKVKKVKGVVLLKDVICHGTPVFGRCDRCCHLFWRVEWLEKLPSQ